MRSSGCCPSWGTRRSRCNASSAGFSRRSRSVVEDAISLAPVNRGLRPLAKAEHVVHVVEARRLSREEFRGAHGALRVGGAAGSAMRELEALAGTREEHGMVADNVAPARHGETDGTGLALARRAVAGGDAARARARLAGVAPGPLGAGHGGRGGGLPSRGRGCRIEERAAHPTTGARDRASPLAHFFVAASAGAAAGAEGAAAGATGTFTGAGSAGRASPMKFTTLSFSKKIDRRVRFSALPPFTLLKK